MKPGHLYSGPGLKIGATASAIAILGAVVLQALPEIVPLHLPLGGALQFGVSLTIIGLQWDIFTILRTTTDIRDRANKLMAALEVSDLHEKELVDLCEAAAGISGKQDLPNWVVTDVEKTIAKLSGSFGNLFLHKRFDLDTESQLMRYLNTLSKGCGISILATSALDGVDSKFWDSEDGKSYLSNQGKTKDQSGRMILRRIFLVRQQDLDDPEKNKAMHKIISQHEKAGFEVGVLTESKLSDAVIFDEKATVFSNRGSHGEDAEGGIADFNGDKAVLQASEFNHWWELAANNRRDYWPKPEQTPAK